jgi:hypothetical protein
MKACWYDSAVDTEASEFQHIYGLGYCCCSQIAQCLENMADLFILPRQKNMQRLLKISKVVVNVANQY